MNWKETPKEALRREIKEEVGIKIRVGRLVGVKQRHIVDFMGKEIYSMIVYYECFPLTKRLWPSSDLVDLKWINKNELRKYIEKEIMSKTPMSVIKYIKDL